MKWSVHILLIFLHSSKTLQIKWLQPCLETQDCETLKNATCVNGVCSCGKDFYVCEENPETIKVNFIGGGCNNASRICHAINSECGPDSVCVCKTGFHPSADLKQCWKGLGSDCLTNEECSSINSSTCINSKCSCAATHVAKDFKCFYLARSIGEICEDDIQCTPVLGTESQCLDGVCSCKNDYHYKSKERTCVKDLFLDEVCEISEDCHQPGKESVSRLMCVEGVCKCRLDYAEEKGYCIDKNAASSRDFQFQIIFISSLFVYFSHLFIIL